MSPLRLISSLFFLLGGLPGLHSLLFYNGFLVAIFLQLLHCVLQFLSLFTVILLLHLLLRMIHYLESIDRSSALVANTLKTGHVLFFRL